MMHTNRFRHRVSLHKRVSTGDGIGGQHDSWNTTADVAAWRGTIHSKSGRIKRESHGDSVQYDSVLTAEPIDQVQEGDMVKHDPQISRDKFIVLDVHRVKNDRNQVRIVRCFLRRRDRTATRQGE